MPDENANTEEMSYEEALVKLKEILAGLQEQYSPSKLPVVQELTKAIHRNRRHTTLLITLAFSCAAIGLTVGAYFSTSDFWGGFEINLATEVIGALITFAILDLLWSRYNSRSERLLILSADLEYYQIMKAYLAIEAKKLLTELEEKDQIGETERQKIVEYLTAIQGLRKMGFDSKATDVEFELLRQLFVEVRNRDK